MHHRILAPLAACLLLLLLAAAVPIVPVRLAAQVPAAHRVENALINGAIGSVSAAVGAAVTGRNPWKALLPGFGGGVAVSAGRQVAGLGFNGSGALGRQISAAGISVIHSAARDTFVLVVPLGPLTLSLQPTAYEGVHPRVNLLEAVTMVYYLLDLETTFDLAGTLSSSAPTFRLPTTTFPSQEGTVYGQMVLGTIVLGAYDPQLFPHTQRDLVRAHESIHILQLDYFNQVAALPVERAVLQRLFPDAWLTRYLDIGLLGPLVAVAFHSQVAYSRRPWEREAVALTEGRRGVHALSCVASDDPLHRRC